MGVGRRGAGLGVGDECQVVRRQRSKSLRVRVRVLARQKGGGTEKDEAVVALW